MQTERIKKIFCWLLVALCMGIIFYFSSKTADESKKQSDGVLNIIFRILGENVFTSFIVRKCAHFLEFAGLSFLFGIAFYVQTKAVQFPLSVCCTSLYAVTDEIHQLFVEGRACRISDWAVDTAGALFGFLLFFAAYLIFSAAFAQIKKKKPDDKKIIDTDNN